MRPLFVLLLSAGLLLVACEPEPGCTNPGSLNFNAEAGIDDGSCFDSLTLSQEELNTVLDTFAVDLTGTAATPDAIPHILAGEGAEIVDPDSTFRDVFTNYLRAGDPSYLTTSIPVGTIFVKRIFLRNPDGSKGARRNTYIMYKQPEGYYPEGGDWEYIAIPWISGSPNPPGFENGVLGAALLRGKVALCATCHAKEGDFVFGNN